MIDAYKLYISSAQAEFILAPAILLALKCFLHNSNIAKKTIFPALHAKTGKTHHPLDPEHQTFSGKISFLKQDASQTLPSAGNEISFLYTVQ